LPKLLFQHLFRSGTIIDDAAAEGDVAGEQLAYENFAAEEGIAEAMLRMLMEVKWEVCSWNYEVRCCARCEKKRMWIQVCQQWHKIPYTIEKLRMPAFTAICNSSYIRSYDFYTIPIFGEI
jgi:hypothetical protein